MSDERVKTIERKWHTRRERYADRDRTGDRVRNVLTNRLDVSFRNAVAPGTEPVIANLINAAARTLTQRVAAPFRTQATWMNRDASPAEKKRAERHEERQQHYALDYNLVGQIRQSTYWLISHDAGPLVMRPNASLGIPAIECRDPLTCYPGSAHPGQPALYECLFATEMDAEVAMTLYPELAALRSQTTGLRPDRVVIGEEFTREGLTIVLLEPHVRLLRFVRNPNPGKPMVFLERGFSEDLDFHGQFDHSIPALIAQAKLFALMMSYAEQQVFAETNIVGEIISNAGDYAQGPGGVNKIAAAPGAGVSKSTNNMSPQVFQELDRLERIIRIGGGFPATLSGEPVATIATGKGVEALNATVDDNVLYWQSIQEAQSSAALRAIPACARAIRAVGAEDFDDKVVDSMRFFKGADSATVIRLLQLAGVGWIDDETAMATLPENEDVGRTMARRDQQMMRKMLLDVMAAELGSGALTGDQVVEMIKQRGDSPLEEVWVAVKGAMPAVPGLPAGAPAGPPSIDDMLGQLMPQQGVPV